MENVKVEMTNLLGTQYCVSRTCDDHLTPGSPTVSHWHIARRDRSHLVSWVRDTTSRIAPD